MNDEQKQKLLVDFPMLFPAPPSCGWSIGEGWFEPIWNLSAEIEAINHDLENPIVCAQIKAKFGSLRFYVDRSEDAGPQTMAKVFFLVDAAVEACRKICKFCGDDLEEPAKIGIGPLAGPVCDPCREERK